MHKERKPGKTKITHYQFIDYKCKKRDKLSIPIKQVVENRIKD